MATPSTKERASPLLDKEVLSSAQRLRSTIEAGFDVETRDENDRTPLMLAVEQGSHAAVEALVAGGADVESRDENCFSALDIAARDDRPDMIRLLVKLGARVDAGDEEFDIRAVHVATSYDSPSAMEALIELGADVEAECWGGNRAIHLCVNSQHPARFVELFLAADANLDAEISGMANDYFAFTPLMKAAAFEDLALMRELIKAGVDLDAGTNPDAENSGERAIHYAITADNREMFDLLCDAGADIDAMESEQMHTPLAHSLWLKRFGLAQALIERGASIFEIPWDEENARTLTHVAAETGDIDALEFLYNAGADLYAEEDNGNTPCDLAKSQGNDDVVEFYEALSRSTRMEDDLGAGAAISMRPDL